MQVRCCNHVKTLNGSNKSTSACWIYELKTGELPKRSWVKISQIRTLSAERIGKKIGRCAPDELVQIIEGLNAIIGT